ncbi:MAG TPA: hypothetical protein ENN55_02020, partial [Firmicutes bacterium]|nr:hypothetical protein [Bacillota bacterium]
FRRCKNRYFNALTVKELEKTLAGTIADISEYLNTVNNFYEVRKNYGKKSAYSEELSGLHILRQGKIASVKDEETGVSRPEMVPVTDEQKTRIENTYEEGGLFYFRKDGSVYPGESESARGKKLFMFADLRNSTETTMKLTKDTASFLSPYLNTVYKVSKENSGNEIYFAGDGYAAHFSKVTDCLRTAYLIHKEFDLLRRDAEVKIRAKEKNIFKELRRLNVLDASGAAIRNTPPAGDIPEDMAGLISILVKNRDIKPEDAVRRTAEEYSMPKVEIGIGITEGELFIAVIGEESVKFNIVLSPSLTQAARLSGSNNKVKEYLEKLYGIKNIPRKVYAYERNLFNQGIAVTTGVFNALRKEAEVDFIGKEEIDLSYDIYFYYDRVLDKYMTMAKLENSVSLKGIGHDVDVFEVFTSVTMADGYINDWIKKEMKGRNEKH